MPNPRIDTDPSQQRCALLFRAGHAERSASVSDALEKSPRRSGFHRFVSDFIGTERMCSMFAHRVSGGDPTAQERVELSNRRSRSLVRYRLERHRASLGENDADCLVMQLEAPATRR